MNYDYNYGTQPHYVFGQLKSKRLNEKFNITGMKNFIETGTYMGDGVRWAVTESTIKFDNIISIEYAKGLADHVRMLFNKFPNVSIINGHSPEILSGLIPNLNRPTLFYLDAHQSGGMGAEWKQDEPCPLIKECSVILEKFYDLNEILIVIDDERMLHGQYDGYPKVQILKDMFDTKELICCYIDDSVVFCKSKWLSTNS